MNDYSKFSAFDTSKMTKRTSDHWPADSDATEPEMVSDLANANFECGFYL